MFICFEGIAGSGKTTQVNLLADYLANTKNKEIFISAAFEGGRRRAVSSFMNASGIRSDQNAVMFLFQALHAVQYRETSDAIGAGKIAIADRWRYSFFAHHLRQDTFSGDEKLLHQLDALAFRSLEPDHYFLVDVPAETAYSRYIEREKIDGDSGLELMGREYFASVADYYKKLACDKGWYVIDGTRDPNAVFSDIKTVIDGLL